MINVDFTTNSGETIYSYSWQNCGGNKNVNFELENPSYTWCTVTHTPENSKVKIHADAVPERQRDPRSANVLMKVNGATCGEYFHVAQPGQPCGCSAFTPISIGATFPSSGAAVGTVIGSYYNDTTCDASKITITGDLQAEAVGGQIKLTSAVGSYNDGRTFNVIFNYDGSECTRGTCTQSAASCRCTSISATPYTFAAPDACGDIRPVTVLTIDGCCSIVTGITGTDSDKFTITTATSGNYKVVKACPSSTNISTSTDRRATVSVTATCGNDTCSSSTTLTQGHSGCTPSTCECYEVLNVEVLSASSLTCDSTSATIKWNFIGYTITNNADCTTAKTQVVNYSASTTVTFAPNTGGQTPVTRFGTYEWLNHRPCMGNTCGSGNITIPWSVELPACGGQSCTCGEFASSVITGLTYEIPSTGIGNAYQTLWEAYVSSESCVNACTIDTTPYSYPRDPSPIVPGDSKVDITNATYGGQQCKKITLSANNMPGNTFDRVNMLSYILRVSGEYCFTIQVNQESMVMPCTCDSFIDNNLIEPINTTFSNQGQGRTVLATGRTNGCGALEGSIQNCSFIRAFSATTEDVIVDGKVVDTKYSWSAIIVSNPGGDTRSCELHFSYINEQGKVMQCQQHFTIIQSSLSCSCPTVPTINQAKTIDGSVHTQEEIAVLNNFTFSEYRSGGEETGYLCQFVVGESDAAWCTAYTEADYNNKLHLIVSCSKNDTGSGRTATINYFSIHNALRNDNQPMLITHIGAYSKAELDSRGKYDTCESCGTLVLTQEAYSTCNSCDGFTLSGEKDNTITPEGGYAYWEFDTPNCADSVSDFYVVFVDENGNVTTQPDFIDSPEIYMPYIGRILVAINIHQNSGSDKSFRFKLMMRIDGGADCESVICSLTQRECNCDDILVNNGSISYTTTYSQKTFYVKIGNGCSCVECEDFNVSGAEYYDWLTFVGVVKSGCDCEAKFTVQEYTSTTVDRQALLVITVNGKNCPGTLIITQEKYVDPCTSCDTIKASVTTNSHICGYNETGQTHATEIAFINGGGCSSVKKISYELEDDGDGTNWVTVNNTSQTAITIYVNSINSGNDRRSLYVNIKYLDNNGNEVLDGCEEQISVIQNAQSVEHCDCDSVSDDASHLNISWPNTTFDGSQYTLTMTKDGQTNLIGDITWNDLPDGLPTCLNYRANNSQSANVILSIREVAQSNRRQFLLYATIPTTAPDSESNSTIVRYNINTNMECTSQISDWTSRILKFILED